MSFWDYLTAGLGFVPNDEHSHRKPVAPKKSPQSIDGNGDKKIAIIEPVTFDDIVRFVQRLGGNVPLIVNFCSIDERVAERGLDFVCGAVCALGGKFQRIGEGIYFYAPKNIKIESDKRRKK